MSADDAVAEIAVLRASVEGRLDDHARRLDHIDERQDAMLTQLTGIRESLAAMRGRDEARAAEDADRAALASDRRSDRRTVWQVLIAAAIAVGGWVWEITHHLQGPTAR